MILQKVKFCNCMIKIFLKTVHSEFAYWKFHEMVAYLTNLVYCSKYTVGEAGKVAKTSLGESVT